MTSPTDWDDFAEACATERLEELHGAAGKALAIASERGPSAIDAELVRIDCADEAALLGDTSLRLTDLERWYGRAVACDACAPLRSDDDLLYALGTEAGTMLPLVETVRAFFEWFHDAGHPPKPSEPFERVKAFTDFVRP